MNFIAFLILFPILTGFLLLFTGSDRIRKIVVTLASFLIAGVSLLLLSMHFASPINFFNPSPKNADIINWIIMGGGIFLDIFIFYITIKYRRYPALALAIVQTVIFLYFEHKYAHSIVISNYFFLDKFSILMALIVGVIGSLICLYSLDYMKQFHLDFRKEVPDQRRLFFFLMFLFLGAMFGLVFSNCLNWMFFFWEITTLCSFLMIGYKGNKESIDNSFNALTMNLLGGVALAAGILIQARTSGQIEVDKIMLGAKDVAIMLPVALIAFAGLTKSAQLPFSSWLLGAMVAPTPVSALLHSSTMVKAGVYVIVRFSHVFEGTACGLTLAIIGGLTFLLTSFAAVPQDDSKKVLAYSTIANLGLVVLCAGIGTSQAIWAAIMLILFHAVSKCLLFLCVGTVEHRIHSRNIEHMAGLILKMPKLSIMMQIGMAGMFLAPFGMLISKWAVLKAMIDNNAVLAVFLVFGGAATMLFWVKWMGKLITVVRESENIEGNVGLDELIPLYTLSLLTVALCAFFPLVSSFFVQPYLIEVYGRAFEISRGNIIIMCIMLSLVFLFPLSFFNYGRNVKVVDAYLCGANADHPTEFVDSHGHAIDFKMSNYYLVPYFKEKMLMTFGSVLSIILIVIMIGVSLR